MTRNDTEVSGAVLRVLLVARPTQGVRVVPAAHGAVTVAAAGVDAGVVGPEAVQADTPARPPTQQGPLPQRAVAVPLHVAANHRPVDVARLADQGEVDAEPPPPAPPTPQGFEGLGRVPAERLVTGPEGARRTPGLRHGEVESVAPPRVEALPPLVPPLTLRPLAGAHHLYVFTGPGPPGAGVFDAPPGVTARTGRGTRAGCLFDVAREQVAREAPVSHHDALALRRGPAHAGVARPAPPAEGVIPVAQEPFTRRGCRGRRPSFTRNAPPRHTAREKCNTLM